MPYAACNNFVFGRIRTLCGLMASRSVGMFVGGRLQLVATISPTAAVSNGASSEVGARYAVCLGNTSERAFGWGGQ